MTVPANPYKVIYTADGTKSSYPYTFRILQATDLLVQKIDTVGNTTTLTYLTDYTVDGVLSYTGGNVNLVAGNLPVNYTLVIADDPVITQLTSLQENGALSAKAIENSLDLLTMQVRMSRDRINRSPLVPLAESPTGGILPVASKRAGTLLGFDAAGNWTTTAQTAALTASVTVGTIATLKAISAPVAGVVYAVSGYYSPGDGGGGSFYWNVSDVTADNGGTVIQLNAGGTGRWNRLLSSGEVDVAWFGAKGDGATDDTLTLRAAFNYAKVLGWRVIFPSTFNCLVSGGFGTVTATTTDFANNVIVDGQGAKITVNAAALATGTTSIITLEGTNVTVRNLSFVSNAPFEQYNTDPATYRVRKIIAITIGGKAASYNAIADSLTYYKNGALVDNCNFTDIHTPIVMTQTSHGKVTNNNVSSYNATAIVIWGCPEDIEVSSNRVTLGADDCIFMRNPLAAQSAWTTAGNYAGGHRVINNRLSYTRAKFVGTAGYSDILIADNICDMSLCEGIDVEADSTIYANGAIYNRNITIARNTLVRAGRFYNTTSGFAYWTGPVNNENIAISTGRSPAVRGSSTLPQNVNIVGNIIDNPSGSAIYLRANDGISVYDNIAYTGTNNQGAGNVNSNGYFIDTNDVTNVNVIGNRIYTGGGVAWFAHYQFGATNFAALDIRVKNNSVAGGETFSAGGAQLIGGKIDYDRLQSDALYDYNKPTPGGTTNSVLWQVGFWGENWCIQVLRAVWGSPNAAATALAVRNHTTSGRSINASGTINASGADYAEYERNNGNVIAKGDIVGFKSDGTLTLKFSEAVRFGIKSTNPSYVGGDDWGSDLEGDDLEAARASVDRIAYSGKVPVNVGKCIPGEYVIAIPRGNDDIAGRSIAKPTFDEYRNAVGRVNRILNENSCEVAVIIH